eukprot:1161334-Pelagomonas_calceolata.AAC.5
MNRYTWDGHECTSVAAYCLGISMAQQNVQWGAPMPLPLNKHTVLCEGPVWRFAQKLVSSLYAGGAGRSVVRTLPALLFVVNWRTAEIE